MLRTAGRFMVEMFGLAAVLVSRRLDFVQEGPAELAAGPMKAMSSESNKASWPAHGAARAGADRQ